MQKIEQDRTTYYWDDCKKELGVIMKGVLKSDTTKGWNQERTNETVMNG